MVLLFAYNYADAGKQVNRKYPDVIRNAILVGIEY